MEQLEVGIVELDLSENSGPVKTLFSDDKENPEHETKKGSLSCIYIPVTWSSTSAKKSKIERKPTPMPMKNGKTQGDARPGAISIPCVPLSEASTVNRQLFQGKSAVETSFKKPGRKF